MKERHSSVLCAQVGIQAYLLWEKAGKPEGADFTGDAWRTLEEQLASGMSLEQLEKALKDPSPQVLSPSLRTAHFVHGPSPCALIFCTSPLASDTERGLLPKGCMFVSQPSDLFWLEESWCCKPTSSSAEVYNPQSCKAKLLRALCLQCSRMKPRLSRRRLQGQKSPSRRHRRRSRRLRPSRSWARASACA